MGETDVNMNGEEPESLAQRLSLLHRQTIRKARKSRLQNKSQYDKVLVKLLTTLMTEFYFGP